jgi:hypothetical protein
VHSFKNTSDTVAHLLCTVVPAGLEEFFRKPNQARNSLPAPALSLEEQEKLKTLAEKY